MNVLLDIEDNQVDFAMNVFRNLQFVRKATAVSTSKATFIKDMQQSMKEVALAKQGKIKLKFAEQLINEL